MITYSCCRKLILSQNYSIFKAMKVLVISANSFSNVYNNGKTMKMMFSNFNKCEVSQLFIRGLNEIDAEAACSFYHIPERNLLKKILFPWLKAGHEIQIKGNNALEQELETSSNLGIKRSITTQILREFVWLLTNWDDKAFWKWIKEQSPEIIYFQAGYPFFMHRMAWKVQKRLGIPMVSHFMDDYVVYPKRTLYKCFLIHIYRKTIKRSSICYSIGKEMAKEYGIFFGKPFLPIMNIVPYKERSPKQEGDILKISYFGSLYYNRIDAILAFAEFLHKKVEPFIKTKYYIQVFSSSEINEQQRMKMQELGVRNIGFVKGNEFIEQMKDSDIFLHVESGNKIYRRLTKLCVSTKIPEYLIFYRPSFAFGPTDLASMKVFSEIDGRMVISDVLDNTSQETINNIANIINCKEVREDIAEKCYKYACDNFLIEKVANSFRLDLENTVDNSK